jgi:hypothetical protein
MTDNTKVRESLIKFGDENPSLDLDFRLHTHGKYLTQEKAIVASRAFKAGAAWQAAQSIPKDKPTECANGCPEKQVCDYCQSMDAALRLIAVNREVVELQERIRQLEQEVNAHRDNEEAFADELQSVSSVPAGQSVPVVGDVLFFASESTETADSQIRYDVCADKKDHSFFPVVRKPTHSIPAAELATLREKAAQLEHELETERMRLVACGVIALSNTADSAINARDMLPEYWSASAQDCASAVDREMDYRSRLTVTERERDELRKDAERYRWIRDKSHSLETRQYDKGIVNGPSCYHEVEGIRELKYEGALDAAIDAAIAQGKGE